MVNSTYNKLCENRVHCNLAIFASIVFFHTLFSSNFAIHNYNFSALVYEKDPHCPFYRNSRHLVVPRYCWYATNIWISFCFLQNGYRRYCFVGLCNYYWNAQSTINKSRSISCCLWIVVCSRHSFFELVYTTIYCH